MDPISSQTPTTAPQPQPVRIKPKVGKNYVTCASVLLAGVIVLVCIMAFVVAKSGVITVPFFSQFYSGPMPTRSVVVAPMSEADFGQEMNARFIAQAAAGQQPPYQIQISEKELTAVMQTLVKGALQNNQWHEQMTQVVVRPTDLEFFGRFQNGPWHADLLARFKPDLTNGVLTFTPVYLQVGDYPLPPNLAYQVASFVFKRDLGTFTLNFGKTGLQSVLLGDGSGTLKSF